MLAVGRAKGRAQPQRAARVLLRAGRAVRAINYGNIMYLVISILPFN